MAEMPTPEDASQTSDETGYEPEPMALEQVQQQAPQQGQQPAPQANCELRVACEQVFANFCILALVSDFDCGEPEPMALDQVFQQQRQQSTQQTLQQVQQQAPQQAQQPSPHSNVAWHANKSRTLTVSQTLHPCTSFGL